MHPYKLVIKPNITMMTMIFIVIANCVVSNKFGEHINQVFGDELPQNVLHYFKTKIKIIEIFYFTRI